MTIINFVVTYFSESQLQYLSHKVSEFAISEIAKFKFQQKFSFIAKNLLIWQQ